MKKGSSVVKKVFFGGSFDPPHIGHLGVARAALASGKCDEVVWFPAADPPHKQNCKRASFDDRMKIVKGEAKKLSYPIDGLVFKYNNCEEYEAAGRTEHHFRGGLAYKFYDELYETTLEDIFSDDFNDDTDFTTDDEFQSEDMFGDDGFEDIDDFGNISEDEEEF